MNTGIAMSRVPLGDLTPLEWMDDAACNAHPKVFAATMNLEKPSVGLRPCEVEAKRICFDCPVVQTCRGWALTHDVAGVAGDLTRWEREDLLRGRPVRSPDVRRCAACQLPLPANAGRSAKFCSDCRLQRGRESDQRTDAKRPSRKDRAA